MFTLIITLCLTPVTGGTTTCRDFEAEQKFETVELCKSFGEAKIKEAPKEMEGYKLEVQEGKCVYYLPKDQA